MASDPLEALGSYIRDQRRQAELSMRKLADLAGVSNPYLSQIERGLKRPSAEILQQLNTANGFPLQCGGIGGVAVLVLVAGKEGLRLRTLLFPTAWFPPFVFGVGLIAVWGIGIP